MHPDVDRRLGRLASRQYGLVTRGQLAELGLSRSTIARRVAAGRLIALHNGVYAVGHSRIEAIAVAAAAVLAGGPGAALSHSSAAALWGLAKPWPTPPEITVARDRRRPGIRVHRSTALTGRDFRTHLGIRATSPARTLLDVAPRLSDAALARCVNDGRVSRYLRLPDLAEVMDRFPRHRGTRLLVSFVQAPTGPTRSQFEDAFLCFARRFDLPEPQINVVVASYEVDVLFVAEKLIDELDGYEFHGNRRSFERDRDRDAATLAAGYPTVRVTWVRLTTTPEREAARLEKILAARRRR
jgi:very-short-patch-repair endonuclease